MTHADIATRLVSALPPGVFAHAARDAVLHADFVLLNRMLPDVDFTVVKAGPDDWKLREACADGSTVIWQVGG